MRANATIAFAIMIGCCAPTRSLSRAVLLDSDGILNSDGRRIPNIDAWWVNLDASGPFRLIVEPDTTVEVLLSVLRKLERKGSARVVEAASGFEFPTRFWDMPDSVVLYERPLTLSVERDVDRRSKKYSINWFSSHSADEAAEWIRRFAVRRAPVLGHGPVEVALWDSSPEVVTVGELTSLVQALTQGGFKEIYLSLLFRADVMDERGDPL